MPEKRKKYDRVIFPPEVIIEAYQAFIEKLPRTKKKSYASDYSITREEESWQYEEKDEFFTEYRRGFLSACLREHHNIPGIFRLYAHKYSWDVGTKLLISVPDRPGIETVYEIFERAANLNKIPLPPLPPLSKRVKIFIGHGKSSDWRDLKDHLHEKHGFEVLAYEVGSRAGLLIKEVLEEMLTESPLLS